MQHFGLKNWGYRGYRYKQAQMKAEQRWSRAKKYIKLNEAMKDYIKAQLGKYESPEQIVGVSKLKGIPIVSIERIYPYIWQDKQDGGLLYKFLSSSNKKRRKRYGSNEKRGQIRNRRWIDERPSIADEKIRIGDFELDTVVGKNHKGFLLTAVERKSKYTLISKSEIKRADVMAAKIIEMFGFIKPVLHTFTEDNGKEFAWHEKIAETPDIDFYFAHPYCSWERGLNEDTNGLIRQFFQRNLISKQLVMTM